MTADAAQINEDAGFYFCGAQAEQLNRARARVMRWARKRELAYCFADRLAGLSVEFQAAEARWCFDQWSEASNGFFTFRQITNPALADIVMTTRRIDRPGGVLAEMQLPPGDDRQLTGWWDTSEQWAQPGFYRAVTLHELGHAMGLDHITGQLAVLNPMLNMALKGLQRTDVDALLAIYTEAANYKPTQPTPGPTPGTPIGPNELRIDAVVTSFGTFGPAVLPRLL